MLKAKIDVTCFPIVEVESKEKLAVPRMARNVLEFKPSDVRNHGFLLYFQDEEKGEENETD